MISSMSSRSNNVKFRMENRLRVVQRQRGLLLGASAWTVDVMIVVNLVWVFEAHLSGLWTTTPVKTLAHGFCAYTSRRRLAPTSTLTTTTLRAVFTRPLDLLTPSA